MDDKKIILQNKRHNFRDLIVWKESMNYAREIMFLAKSFPAAELYGFVSQINRSAIFIASNIAESTSRKSKKTFVNYLEIALGFSYESETQLILAIHLGSIKQDEGDVLLNKVHSIQKMLSALISKLES
jgi:four helix bundle protein